MSVPFNLFAGKVCRKCNLWQPFTAFHHHAGHPDKRASRCRYCESSRDGGPDPVYLIDSNGRECNKCRIYKPFEQFDKGKNPGGRRETCKSCRKEKRRQACIRAAMNAGRVYRPNGTLSSEEKRRRNLERSLKWQKDFPDKARARGQRRRARLNSCSGEFTDIEWRIVCIRFRYRCTCCNQRVQLYADHIIPIAKGGPNIIENIQPLCRSCNSRKHVKTVDYRPEALRRLGRFG